MDFLFFPYPGNIGNMFFLYFGIFPKKTRADISRRMHWRMSRDLSYETDSGPKTKTVSDPNFQVTAATAAATATSQQLSHLARALDHHAQGPNILFGVNPSLRSINTVIRMCTDVRGFWKAAIECPLRVWEYSSKYCTTLVTSSPSSSQDHSAA